MGGSRSSWIRLKESARIKIRLTSTQLSRLRHAVDHSSSITLYNARSGLTLRLPPILCSYIFITLCFYKNEQSRMFDIYTHVDISDFILT